jgi:YVTN family beta-propeller protein
VFLTNGMPTKPNVKTQLNPAGVAVASNGHVYVANFGANTVTTYDATGKPISPTITGLSGPFALAFDPSGQLCVLNQTSATITKYQADGTPTGTIDLPTIPPTTTFDGFAIALDGPFWVSQTNYGNMVHLDAAGNLLQSYFVGGTPAGVALPKRRQCPFRRYQRQLCRTSRPVHRYCDNVCLRLDAAHGPGHRREW